MSREDAIDDLLARLAAAAGIASELGLPLAAYLLNIAMLEVATGPCADRTERQVPRKTYTRRARQ
jgi:H+/Cl- antiporter ClcA